MSTADKPTRKTTRRRVTVTADPIVIDLSGLQPGPELERAANAIRELAWGDTRAATKPEVQP